ncbi:Gfo/Idh/MocA family protein [Rathayibacter sp. VKM Ac-2928]|uniref:Gfo/Idh/MocA family protein n=1 Tax=Rathayibacter sp. VKM Ac-2928 TaxID=2929479 RepID=UPI001FB5079F|nr:Gfo/Idh/MocA family oxidoreductase [Rathayibacter sp. VKM Ac-2928]MCJ1682770.1 Gfo/Idh/MocA family oxidoreductase [Rathayibacter sp. VKM Ac-2928]
MSSEDGGDAPPLRWGILGTGRISESFVPDIRAAGGVVGAVWGRRTETVEAFAAAHGVPRSTTELDALLGDAEIDVVYVATPPATHLEFATRALEAGKHVLVEKPMTTSAADSARLFETAAEHGRFVMEAMWMTFNPLHLEVAREVRDGVLGTPRYVRAAFGMPFPAGGSRWQADLGGSTVLDQGIYPVTLAEWLLGPVVSVSATGVVRDGVDVAAQISLQHRDGGSSQLACSVLEFLDPSASVSGTAGWIEIPAMFWAGDVARVHAGSQGALFGEPIPLRRPREGNGYVPMIRSVAATVSAGLLEHPEHDAAATLSVARVLDEIRGQVFAEAAR